MSKPSNGFRCATPLRAALIRTHALFLITGLLILGTALLIASGTANASSSSQGNAPLNHSGSFTSGEKGQPYNAVLNVNGGSAPYQFTLRSGSLPPGTTLNPSTGSITGTPSASGSYTFEIGVTDSPRPEKGLHSFQVVVNEAKQQGNVQVSVSPASVNLYSSQTQQFSATVSGTPNTAVTWSATTGSISKTGLYTAPVVNTQSSVTVTATSVADTSKSANSTAALIPGNGQSLSITSGNPPDGQVNTAYSSTFTAAGGTQPYSWSLSAGNLPKGVSLSQSGQLSGTPTASGTSNFSVTVTDKASHSAQGSFGLDIAGAGNFDGPAELPRVNVSSTMADTPAPGNRVQVSASSDPQTAINNAQCGDTIELQAGATYSSLLTLPAKHCDDQHWIIIRTSAPDSALPPEGTRLTPCYAGVASLPNRPSYNCSNPQNVLAKI